MKYKYKYLDIQFCGISHKLDQWQKDQKQYLTTAIT